MDDNGKLVKDATLTYVKNNKGIRGALMKTVEGIIEICANIKVDDNHCEAAIQYEKCFKKELNAHHIH